MLRACLVTLGLTPVLFAPVAASAQGAYDVLDPLGDDVTREGRAEDDRITVIGGADYTTAYFFRGFYREDARAIVQPYVTAYFNLHDGAEYDVAAFAGTWHSLHEQPSQGDGIWFEADYYAGVDITRDRFTLGAIYTIYTFPSDPGYVLFASPNESVTERLDTVHEAGVKLAFDDAGLWDDVERGFALRPYVAAYVETEDEGRTELVRRVQMTDPSQPQPQVVTIRREEPMAESVYLELGAGPELDLGGDMILTLPVVLGLGMEDYYLDEEGEDTLLGYSALAARVSSPLSESGFFRDWLVVGQVSWIHLFADELVARNTLFGTENDDIFILKVGLQFVR